MRAPGPRGTGSKMRAPGPRAAGDGGGRWSRPGPRWCASWVTPPRPSPAPPLPPLLLAPPAHPLWGIKHANTPFWGVWLGWGRVGSGEVGSGGGGVIARGGNSFLGTTEPFSRL